MRDQLADLGYEAAGQDFMFDMAQWDGNRAPRIHDNAELQRHQANSIHSKNAITEDQQQTSSARKRKLSELADSHNYHDPPLSRTNHRTSSRDLMPPPLPKSKLPQQLRSPLDVQSRAVGSLWRTPSQQPVQSRQEGHRETHQHPTFVHNYAPQQILPFRPSPSRMRQRGGQLEELDAAQDSVHRNQLASRNIQDSHASHFAPRVTLASPALHRSPFPMPNVSRSGPMDSRVLPRRNPDAGTIYHGEELSNDHHPPESQRREPLQAFTSSQINRLSQRNEDGSHHTPRSQAGLRQSGVPVTSPFFREDRLPDIRPERPPTRHSMAHSSFAEQRRDYRDGLSHPSTPSRASQPTLNGLSFIDYPHRTSDHQPLYSSPSHHVDTSHHSAQRLAPSSRDFQGLFQRPPISRSSAVSRTGDRPYLTDPRYRISFAPSQGHQVPQERVLSQIRGVRGVNSQPSVSLSRTRPTNSTGYSLPQAGSRRPVYQ